MWIRRKAAAAGGARLAPAMGMAPATCAEPASFSTSSFPVSAEEHPAARRIRRANELADAMRPTGGRHRRED
jgi:hypothetical protein